MGSQLPCGSKNQCPHIQFLLSYPGEITLRWLLELLKEIKLGRIVLWFVVIAFTS